MTEKQCAVCGTSKNVVLARYYAGWQDFPFPEGPAQVWEKADLCTGCHLEFLKKETEEGRKTNPELGKRFRAWLRAGGAG